MKDRLKNNIKHKIEHNIDHMVDHKINSKMKQKIQNRLRLLFYLLLISCCLWGCENERNSYQNNYQQDTYSYKTDTNNKNTNNTIANNNNLQIHYIDVGQGECTLITNGEHAMIIDAGNNNKGTAIQQYLNSLGIKELDYVIGTHPDSDHIGGLDVILYKFSCNTILMPDYSKDTDTYDDVIETLKEKRYEITAPVVGNSYPLGDATFTIIAPNGSEYQNANDYSIGIILQHGDNKFLFTGDAEEDSEIEMLSNGINLKANVYLVAHHGSKTASISQFLDEVDPEYAVISSGEGNSYGHPHAKVLNELRKRGIQVFRTDEQGTIVVASDGKSLKWNCSPSESWKAGEPQSTVTQDSKDTLYSKQPTLYILNINTRKFHLPSCSSVDDIAESNKEKTSLTQNQLIEKGYDPCKRCIGE